MEDHTGPIRPPRLVRGEAKSIDLAQFLRAQIEWSEATFGPGYRTDGILDHIEKELVEIREADHHDAELAELVDVVILALDAMWRLDFSPEQICRALLRKAEINRSRRWPDWRTAEPGKAIEHIREEDRTDG